MKIPKQIQLHGQTINTIYEDDLGDHSNLLGVARHSKNELSGDEEFVDIFGSLLHQALSTAVY